MAYPATTLWGVGAPRFILDPNTTPGRGSRRTGAVITVDMPALSIESPEPTFTPVRFDGGDTTVILDDGRIIDRSQGFRFEATFIWKNLTLAQVRDIVYVFNYRAAAQIVVQPRIDSPPHYRIIPVSLNISHPEGLYVTHEATLTVIGKDVLGEIPLATTESPEYYYLEF